MVCLGNICRSPMAEGLMRAKIKFYSLDAEVDSAGFESFHTGDAPDYRAIKTMKLHGIDISGQKSRLFKLADFNDFDHIFVMDKWNYADVEAVAKDRELLRKVDYILNAVYPGSNQPVPDPYSGGLSDFESVYQLLDKATELIAKELKKKEG